MNTLAHWRTRANALLAVSIISTAMLQSPVSLAAHPYPEDYMQSFFFKTFGGLPPSYYTRQLIFGALITAGILWVLSSSTKGMSANPGMIALLFFNTLLYPYSRFLYERVVGFIMGGNIFFVNAAFMLAAKVITMSMCWSFAIFIAPVGLAYLYWHNSRQTML
ncbi:hypothetical protein [Pseudomonas capsici]|nr:hypothetical protein [Pseudomonas capsici]